MPRSIYQLERELEYARARQTYRQNYRPPENAQPSPRPTTPQCYYSLLVKINGQQASYKVNTSNSSVDFFGLTNLGLDNTAAELADALPKPKSLKPSMVKAVIGDPTPMRIKAYNNTGRPYWRYNKNAEGTNQSFYSAPICKKSATVTLNDLDTQLSAIVTAKRGEIGIYGRLYLQSERNGDSYL